MEKREIVWSRPTQHEDILGVAWQLQQQAAQVDVYLEAVRTRGDQATAAESNPPPAPATADTGCGVTRKVFPAHRVVLAAASPFLHKVLCEHYWDHRDACTTITLPQVSPATLTHILDFVYRGQANIPLAERIQVLEAAKLLQIVGLVACLQPTGVKVEEGCVVVASGVVASGMASTGVAALGVVDSRMAASDDKTAGTHSNTGSQGKKRKTQRKGSSVKENSCGLIRKIKKETDTLIYRGNCEERQLGRSCRKIKNRYSPDDYELSLPELRHMRRKYLPCEPTKQKDSVNIQDSEESVPDNSSGSFSQEVKCIVTKLVIGNGRISCSVTGEDGGRCSTLPLASTCTEVCKKREWCDAHVIASPPPPSKPDTSPADLPHLFTAEAATAYLQEATPPGESLQSPDSSLLPAMKELVSSSPALADVTLKQDGKIFQKSCKDLYEEKSEDQYEDDGLFKFQVLIKECEAFSGSATSPRCEAADEAGDQAGRHQGSPDGVDINQWISEEINSYLQPQTNNDNESRRQDDTVEGQSCQPVTSATQDTRPSHTTTDNKKTSFECEQCGKKFYEVRRCQSHMLLVHREARQMCRYCGKMFKRRCDLLQHERRHKTPTLPCKLCEKVFKLPKDLAAHMTTHNRERRYTCNTCNKQLTSFRNLRNHIASLHQRQRAFICQICNKGYSKSCSLQVHMRSVHTGERPFSCNVCNKTFHDRALLKMHRAVHTGEQKYCCKVCGRGFTQYSNMMSHQRVHTNKRPFTCLICRENFKTKESLMKHKWTHTGLKPLRCHHCSKDFRVKGNYEKHMLRSHNELVSLPELYFEVPEEMVPHEVTLEAASCCVVGTSSEQDAPSLNMSTNTSKKIQTRDGVNKDLLEEEEMSPVVQLMRDMTEEARQVHITYPLLSSNPEFDDSHDIPISKLTTASHVQSIDVGALLRDEMNIASSTQLVDCDDSTRGGLTASITDNVASGCKDVVILDKFSEDNSEIHKEIHSSSTNIIWMPDDNAVMDNTDNLDDKANIFIVSDETMPVLSSGLVSPVVHTVILNTPEPDL